MGDPYAYDPVSAGNCLAELQETVVQRAADEQRQAQHQQYKDLRAAIARPWKLIHDKDFSQEVNVKAMAEANRRLNPMQSRYSDTWDAELIFHRLKKLYLEG